MDKYYISINADLASSFMISCQIMGLDFDEQIKKALESRLGFINDEIEFKERNPKDYQKYGSF